MPLFTPIDHEVFVADVGTLAAAIRADTSWQPTFLIGIGRGGLVPAVYLSHATGVPMLSCDLSAHVEEFADDVLVRLAARTRNGERSLFVDDINDSGSTIAHLRAALAIAGGVAPAIPLRDADRQLRIGATRRLSRPHHRPYRHQGLVRLSLGSARPRRGDRRGRRGGPCETRLTRQPSPARSISAPTADSFSSSRS